MRLLTKLLQQKLEKVQQLIAPRVLAAETARAQQHANSAITANLLAWLTDEVNVDEYSFAQYCAMCAVLDERVVDLQLKRCSNADVKALLCSLFGHGDDITNFLVHNSAQATAAQTALLGLLKVEWRDGEPLDVARKMCDVVCCMQRPNEIDDHLWHDIRGFFHCLVSVRWLEPEVVSEPHFSIGAGLCFLAPFVFRADTYMNQALFNTKRDLPELLKHYNVNEAAVCDFADDDNTADDENSIVPFDNKKQRLPGMWARMKTSTKATEVSESTATVLVVCEVKPPRAPPAVVAEDARRLVFCARTCADLRAVQMKLGDSMNGAQQGDASSASLGTSHAMTDAQSDGAEKCTGTEQSRGGVGTGETAPGPHRRIGSFGLQVVGTRAILTLMTQVHQSLYANLRLRDLDFRTCSLPDAINYLVLMIAISECDINTVTDGDVAGKLLTRAEWEKLDASIKGQLRVAPPIPNLAPAPPHANGKQSGAAGARKWGWVGSKKVIAGIVARGNVVSDHGERAVVRGGAGGQVALKVLLASESARQDAVHELCVHELLTRRAAAHVVPLMAHCEAPVVLPGEFWARHSIVLVMPWCEPVNVGDLVDAREEAQCVDELLAALAALHRLGVLHYDVKWSNTLWLVLDGTGERRRRLVLSDFGLAKQLDVDGRATLQRGVGTDEYMAPEVRDGSAMSATAAVDVYSAGAALRKLPAHAQCEELQELARWMCAEQPHARPTANSARHRVRCVVAPAMQQLVIATQPVNAT
jgi:serine/threonine protein kinase